MSPQGESTGASCLLQSRSQAQQESPPAPVSLTSSTHSSNKHLLSACLCKALPERRCVRGAQAAWARDGWPAPRPAPPSPLGPALCTGGTAALGGLLHLGCKGSSIAALEGHFPPLLLQPLAAAGTRARTPALHPGQRPRGPADGIAPLHLVKVPDGVPPACGLWMGQTPRDSLRAHRGAGKRPEAAVGGGRCPVCMHSAWRRRRDGTRGHGWTGRASREVVQGWRGVVSGV